MCGMNLTRQGDLSLRRVEIRPPTASHVHFQGRGHRAAMCRRGDRSAPTLPNRSNLQLLWKTREDSTTSLCDYYDIFLAHAPNARVVKTRLDREHLAIFENNLLQT